MAFTFCTNCGERLDESVEKCPHCGQVKGADIPLYNDSSRYNRYEPNKDQGNNPSGSGYNNGNSYNPNEGFGKKDNDEEGFGDEDSPYSQNPFGQNPNRYGQSPYGQNPYGQNPYGQNPNGQNPYGQGPFPPFGRPPFGSMQRQISIGLLIFSIINIVFGCCCTGTILGVMGLIFTVKARDAQTDESEKSQKRAALVLNIFAALSTFATVVAYVITVILGLAEAIIPALSIFTEFFNIFRLF